MQYRFDFFYFVVPFTNWAPGNFPPQKQGCFPETGILTKANPDLETSARTAAEQEILNAALDDGILAQADANARAYLLSLFNSLGFPRVVFSD